MKKLSYILIFLVSASLHAQKVVKSKNLQLKYTLPENWSAEEFGGMSPWEEGNSSYCKCAGVAFSKPHKDGKMHVVVYPSTVGGLDSAKRSNVGHLHFENVIKYDKTTNKNFSFEKRKSNFTDLKSKSKSFEVIRFQAKHEGRIYVFYAWQESMNALNSTNERELMEMVNAIEPL